MASTRPCASVACLSVAMLDSDLCVLHANPTRRIECGVCGDDLKHGTEPTIHVICDQCNTDHEDTAAAKAQRDRIRKRYVKETSHVDTTNRTAPRKSDDQF